MHVVDADEKVRGCFVVMCDLSFGLPSCGLWLVDGSKDVIRLKVTEPKRRHFQELLHFRQVTWLG